MDDAHEQLGGTLRAWRERLAPADVGIAGGSKRRAKGLRREEVAALADLSVDYVVKLEQGRAAPSAQVVVALARALQLDRAERDHLHRLAGLQAPADGVISKHIPPGVQRLIARLGEMPIAVFSADWELISWSPLWAVVMGDPSTRPERSLIRSTFRTDRDVPGYSPWPVVSLQPRDEFRAALVSDLRAATARYPHDGRLHTLVAELRGSSPEFAALWDSGRVAEHVSGRKTIKHPVGDITLDCDVLAVPGVDLHLVVYSAPEGTPDSELIDFLRVTGPAQVRG